MAPRSPDFKRQRSMIDLISDTRKPKLLPETGWYRVAITENFEGPGVGGQYVSTSTIGLFTDGWENVGDGNAPASWYLSNNGEVRLRGKIDGGEEETVAFILPEEVRPEYPESFIVAMDGGGQAQVVIRTNGEVYISKKTGV